MNQKLIKDIRLMELDEPNIDYNATPYYMGKLYHYDHMACLEVIQRLLFALRSRDFGFADFDHLYLNFTPCVPHGEVREVNRYQIREFAWYQYVDAGCDVELFNSWTHDDQTAFVLDAIRNAVLLKAPTHLHPLFCDTFEEVIREGAQLLLPYKRKENENYTVEILVRIDDEVDFHPLIRVTDTNGTIRAEETLRPYGRDEFISQIGTITMGKRSLRIAPRKNWNAEFFDLKPVKIQW